MLRIHPWLIYNDTNKLVRLRRLSPHLAAHRIRLKANSPGTQLLLDQLRQFPTAEHDDGPDALEMALRLASEMLASSVPPDNLGSRLPVGYPFTVRKRSRHSPSAVRLRWATCFSSEADGTRRVPAANIVTP
jgi:hypothetical protein